MTITFGTPNGPFVIGPGAVLNASSTLLGLGNPPYHWEFDFTGPDTTFHFTQTTITTTETQPAATTLLWQDLDTPADLLAQIHARLNDTVQVRVTVRDDAGLVIDGPVTQGVPWDPIAWLNLNQRLWNNNLVTRLTEGGSSDKLDQVLAAVYKTWPDG